jgi:hypothetical protein
MIPERAEVMEKAKAKRRRREERKRLRNGSHKERTVSSEVVNLAEGTVAQLTALVKTAARKITGS